MYTGRTVRKPSSPAVSSVNLHETSRQNGHCVVDIGPRVRPLSKTAVCNLIQPTSALEVITSRKNKVLHSTVKETDTAERIQGYEYGEDHHLSAYRPHLSPPL